MTSEDRSDSNADPAPPTPPFNPNSGSRDHRTEDGPRAKRFPCGACGAKLEFKPGTDSLSCPYCGHLNPIEQTDVAIEELDFHAQLAELEDDEAHDEVHVVRCDACAAETTFDPHVTSATCGFCGANIVAQAKSRRRITPRALLPFHIEKRKGLSLFNTWIGGLWFAPSALTKLAHHDDRLQGVYVPYWTFDAEATSDYAGQRGDNYWVTQTYSVMENGKSVTRTRQVQKIRWSSASGRVHDSFDDVLVISSKSLPKKLAEKLEPWDLANLVPYDDAYLPGMKAESYQIDLCTGFELAAEKMEVVIRQTVHRDIGGDHQRISALQVQHRDITFKHVLLPIWISAYQFSGKTYRFLVNGRTGEVQGERPYSFWKIFSLVILIVAVIGVIVFVTRDNGPPTPR